MAGCTRPIDAWFSKTRNPSGKRSVVFKREDAHIDMPVRIPCGKCPDCRLEKSRQWAVRIMHENDMHDDSCFITLTFDEDHLDPDYSLQVKDFQNFMKRLRKKLSKPFVYFNPTLGKEVTQNPVKVRFFHVGEYGEQFGRPHHHAIIFGYDFPDKVVAGTLSPRSPFSLAGPNTAYVSSILSELWAQGLHHIGSCTFESAAYVARYTLKKNYGEQAEEYYNYQDPETGRVISRKPEFATMSRRPGIGAAWFETYQSDIFPNGYVTSRDGIKMRVPRAYLKKLELTDPGLFRKMKAQMLKFAKENVVDSPEHLEACEYLTSQRVSQLRRKLK